MKKLKGFTLIELMVVIAIIIILAAIAIPNYINMTKRAQRSRATSDAAVLATSLEVYKTEEGHYPATTWAVMKPALIANDAYISAATMGQIEASENLTTGPTYVTADGQDWTITITTPDGQTGTRTSAASIMTWGAAPPEGPPAGAVIGQEWGGGKIAYLDGTGQHGLIAATADLANADWSTAISECASYAGGGYDDWYLPSKDELDQLYQHQGVIGGFNAGAAYWSSTESSNDNAWKQFFEDGYQASYYSKYFATPSVRAVRTF